MPNKNEYILCGTIFLLFGIILSVLALTEDSSNYARAPADVILAGIGFFYGIINFLLLGTSMRLNRYS